MLSLIIILLFFLTPVDHSLPTNGQNWKSQIFLPSHSISRKPNIANALSVQGPSPPVVQREPLSEWCSRAFGSLIAWAKASFEVRTKAWSGGGAVARFERFHSQIAFFHLGIWVISVWVDGCRNPKKNKESIKILFMKSGGVMELMRERERVIARLVEIEVLKCWI